MRAVQRSIAFQLRGRLLHRATTVQLGERSQFLAYVHWSSAATAVYANLPQPNEMAFWRRTLRDGDVFVDVGANVGLFTIWALDCGAQVVAVEPDAAALTRLRENLALNGYQAELHQCALGDVRGTLPMTSNLGVANFVAFDDVVEQSPSSHATRLVEVATLDDIIGDREIAGAKIDVEGAELRVLEGAAHALAEHRIAALQLEWNSTSHRTLGQGRRPVAELLASYGYELFRPAATGELTPLDRMRAGPDVIAISPDRHR